jgi:hypothetical protein
MRKCTACGLETNAEVGSCICPVYHSDTTCPLGVDGQSEERFIKEIIMRAITKLSGPDLRSWIIADGVIAALEQHGYAIGSFK